MRKAHQGRIAAISGAASGIGQACGVRLAQEGAQIVGVDRENAKQTLDLISAVDGSATAITCDVSEPAIVATLKNAVEANIRRCDILMNNARIYPAQRFDEITFEDWRHVHSVNLDSMFLMTKAFAGGMRQRGWGRVINIASDTVRLLVPEFVHYISSKAGVIGFTRSIATELGAEGVTANAIDPGLARTPGSLSRKQAGGMSNDDLFALLATMQSIKRSGEVSDLVGTVSYLASDNAALITGQALSVNGGRTRTT
jgi:NAD(P)-dependent dehydrogenase (short-subunit alcohol dehydrogenase family)